MPTPPSPISSHALSLFIALSLSFSHTFSFPLSLSPSLPTSLHLNSFPYCCLFKNQTRRPQWFGSLVLWSVSLPSKDLNPQPPALLMFSGMFRDVIERRSVVSLCGGVSPSKKQHTPSKRQKMVCWLPLFWSRWTRKCRSWTN